MPEQKSPRGLVEASLLASLTVILYLISVYVPLVGIIAMFVVPIPIIIVVMRRGIRVGIMASVVSAFLIGLMTSPFQGVSVLFSVGLVGIAMGGALGEGETPFRTVVYGAVATAISTGVLYLLSILILGNNPYAEISKMMTSSMDAATSLYKRMGMTSKQIKDIKTMLDQSLDMVKLTIPAGLFIFSAASATINYILTYKVARRLGFPISSLPAIRNWAFPKWVSYCLFLGVAIYLAGMQLSIHPLMYAGINVIYSAGALLLMQGLGAVNWILEKAGKTGMRWFLIFLFVWNAFFFAYILVLVGVMDTFRNFRNTKV